MTQITTDVLLTSLIDHQTGRQVFASSLVGKALSGWTAWQDARYTTDSPYTLVNDVEQRLEFDSTQLEFLQNGELPRAGSKIFPLWDFDTNKLLFYKQQIGGLFNIRFQATARALTSGSGKGVEVILQIPNSIAIFREVKSTLKGTSPQRVSFNIPFYVTQGNVDNGLELYLQALNDNFEIYNINILIQSGS